MTPNSPATAPGSAQAPTHGCARCGAPVSLGVGLCERCNPLGLRDVSASQVHGTVFVAVAVAIVLLAVIARLAVAGAGPFPVSLEGVTPAGDGLELRLTVTNEGQATGQTTCRVHDVGDHGGGPSAFVLSPRIEPGESVTFQSTVTVFGSDARDFQVDCRTP